MACTASSLLRRPRSREGKKEVEAPDEPTFSAGSGGPKSVLAGWLWPIPSDDNWQFLTHPNPDDSPTGNLGARAFAHTGSGSVSSAFSPALSVDPLYWLLRISVPKQAGKEFCGKPCP